MYLSNVISAALTFFCGSIVSSFSALGWLGLTDNNQPFREISPEEWPIRIVMILSLSFYSFCSTLSKMQRESGFSSSEPVIPYGFFALWEIGSVGFRGRGGLWKSLRNSHKLVVLKMWADNSVP